MTHHEPVSARASQDATSPELTGTEIAILSMAGRFPGARTLEDLWINLRDGVESVRFFRDQELKRAGVPEAERRDPRYVAARGVLEDIDQFDPEFFGYSPREAEAIDPQHRFFMECCHECLDRAGYGSRQHRPRVGVYGGASRGTYYWQELAGRPEFLASLGAVPLEIGNDPDFLTTKVSYALGLTGPSVSVHTACSTSLVAVHFACQSLLQRECDLALAGGVSIRLPQVSGYRYQDGGVASPDGHCRAFDARAQGTVNGNGAAVLLFKRMEDALADRDSILAVIKGTAINNDGPAKVGFTAPSVEGQAEVIAEALAVAEVEPESLGMLEAHGTGTPLGDPIEVEALTRVFREQTPRTGFCALGTIKSNFGHLDAAAGATGLIKAVLSLHHQVIPPSLHFESPNPRLQLQDSPFFVPTKAMPWSSDSGPRRAGISSFGIGGTNAHVVLEEAPRQHFDEASPSEQLLLLSARSTEQLETASQELAAAVLQAPHASLEDVALTLQRGREPRLVRRAVVASTMQEAAEEWASLPIRSPAALASIDRPVAFLFPGQGAQRPAWGQELRGSSEFDHWLTRGIEGVRDRSGIDLEGLLFPSAPDTDSAIDVLRNTAAAQPALFVLQFAMAQFWMSQGVTPTALLGHSVGQITAAAIAEVVNFEEALTWIVERGRVMQEAPSGTMVAVPLPPQELKRRLPDDLGIAVINAPSLCAVGGPEGSMQAFSEQLRDEGIRVIHLAVSHAFHTAAMEPILNAMENVVQAFHLKSPRIPLLSNETGTWMSDEEAIDARTWVRHVRQPVRFSDNVAALTEEASRVSLELGPGDTLTQIVKQQSPQADVVAPMSTKESSTTRGVLHVLGDLWCRGAAMDLAQLSSSAKGRRIPLPPSPLQRRRIWPGGAVADADSAAQPSRTPPKKQPPTLQAVVDTFHEVLGVKPDADLGFFDAGGNSLLALQLLSLVEARFGTEVSLNEFLQCSTAATLLARVEADPSTSHEPVSRWNTGGSREPLFLIHPIGGQVLCYASLARALGVNQPLIAIASRGLNPQQQPGTTIEEIAADALNEIRQSHGNGPQLLGGWSFGGVVAWEVARQMAELRLPSPSLYLFDSAPPTAQNPDLAELESHALPWFLTDLLGTQAPVADSRKHLRSVSTLQDAWNRKLIPEGLSLSTVECLYRVFLANLRALSQYRARPIPASVHCFLARERTPEIPFRNTEDSAAPSFRGLTQSPPAIHRVAGNHFTMLSPEHLPSLVSVLRSRLSPGSAGHGEESGPSLSGGES